MERNTSNQRPGCVSAWLWLAVVLNIASAIMYISFMFLEYRQEEFLCFGAIVLLNILNVLACILLFRHIKNGFNLIAADAAALAVVATVLGTQATLAVAVAIVSVIIWWAVLQAKKDGVSAWTRLKGGWDWKHCRHLYQVFIVAGLLVVGLTFVAMPWGRKAAESEYTSFEDGLQNDELEAIDTMGIEAPSKQTEAKSTEEMSIWEAHSDDGHTCSVEAPSHYEIRVSEPPKVLWVAANNDDEPSVTVYRQKRADIERIGITSAEEYASSIMNGYGKVAYLGGGQFGDGGYLVRFTMNDGTNALKFYVLAKDTPNYYYYCLVICLQQNDSVMRGRIDHILKSFKVN